MTVSLLEVRGVNQSFGGSPVLRDVDLAVERGDVFALIGPTGAGKTTLLRVLDLIERPASGTVIFDGEDVSDPERVRLAARRKMAYVPQKPVLFTGTVADNVALALKWRKVDRSEITRRVRSVLETVDMPEFADRAARSLSGGETQRVALARALVTEPELLFLDEPTANLDPNSTDRVERVLERVIAVGTTTVVMSTHDMEQGQRLATRMGVLIDGRIRQIGPPQEVFRSPSDEAVAGFIGVGNMLPGRVTRRLDPGLVEVEVDGTTVEAVATAEPGTPVWAVVRTEDVTFSTEPHPSSARNTFSGPITRVVAGGLVVRVEIDCGFPLIGVVTARSATEMGLAPGVELTADFKATAVHVLDRIA